MGYVMDSERNYFPKMEVATDEEWQKLQPMLDKAKAEGNPWAFTAFLHGKEGLIERVVAAVN